jgi:hypothetical protein
MRLMTCAAVAVILQLQTATADEIKLRCDPMSGSDEPIVLSINTSANTVYWGGDNKYKKWYKNGDEYDAPRDAQGDMPNDRQCTYHWKDTVVISNDEIKFGYLKTNIDYCGSPSDPKKPGDDTETSLDIIDRSTGILTEYSKFMSEPLHEYDRYQCQKLTKVF